MSIIAVSGKSGDGKDTVGKIIQFLIYENRKYLYSYEKFLKEPEVYQNGTSGWEIKKFATKLKQITCMMLGCTMKQLEDQEFKKQPLPNQWQNEYSSTESSARTYRWFLQTLGTESTREMIHNDFWINGLFADYKVNNHQEGKTYSEQDLPNWIITDLRFPNELRAIKQHKGITIRVNRRREDKYYYQGEYCNLESLKETIKQETGEYPLIEYCKNFLVTEHESETALDKVKFDYVVDNNGTIEELIERVRLILIQEKII